MFAKALPVALVIFLSTFATGDAQAKDCTLANDFCVPVMGCINASGERFTGQTFGRRAGPVEVRSSTGMRCAGTWKRTAFGGKASLACSDGRKGAIKFNYFNAQTGTVGGVMTLDTGDQVEILAGHRISAFLKSGKKIRGKSLTCRVAFEEMLAQP